MFWNLVVGAFVLLITGQIRMLGLCNFSCAFNVGGECFFGLDILSLVCLWWSCIVAVFSVWVFDIWW